MTVKITPEMVTIALAIFTAVLLPGVVAIMRSAAKWAKLESKLEEVVCDVKELVENKDKVHAAMLDQMKVDRDATDRRLRWLEENVWRRGRNNAI